LSDGLIRLRPPSDADADWISEAVADPEIPRWTRIRSPYTKDDAFAWIALAESMLREGNAFHLLVAGAQDRTPLGSVGLEVHARPSRHGEIGYWIAAAARGRGFATRAVRLLAGWGLERLELPEIEIHVMPANSASQAVARKAGFSVREQRLLPFRTTIEEFDIFVREAAGAATKDRPGA
jgi:RimJ/RimL family protein N-acetyltransferase